MMVIKIKSKRYKNCFIKQKLNFEDHKHCLKATLPHNDTNITAKIYKRET